MTKKRKKLPPVSHHLDRRATDIVAASTGPPDELLTTKVVAKWLGVSVQWCEIARHRGYGPRFHKFSARKIRYRRIDILAWLETRVHSCTSEYAPRAHLPHNHLDSAKETKS